MEHLKAKAVEQFKKLESITKDYQECCKSKVSLIEVNSRLEEDLDRTRMELRDKLKVLERCQSENSEKYPLYRTSIVEALKDALSRHAETEALLANQIMELKNKLMESQSYFLRFDVMKIATLQNASARLTLRRMPAGTHVLDIESKGVISSYYDKMLENVALHPSKANRFIIKVVSESNKEFESVEAEAIVKAVRKFMFPQLPEEYAME